MGFGVKLDVKVEVPKVEVPKVDAAAAVSSVTGAVSGAVDSAKGAVSGAVDSAKSAVNGAVSTATGAVNGAVSAATEAANSVVSVVTKAVASLTTVAGAIADVAVSFTGKIEDFALEPHLSLDANASFGKTKFEKGPIWIRVEDTPEKAKVNTDTLHLFTTSGAYDKTQKVCEFSKDNGKTVDLLFEEAPMDELFSLEVIKADGGIKTIFSDVEYGDLRKTKQRYM